MRRFLPAPKTAARAAIVFGVLGLTDAIYLTVNHYANLSTVCYAATRCDLVLTSSYAVIFGVPTALLGALYYAAVVGLSGWFLWRAEESVWRYLRLLVSAGFIFSLYLVYLQVFTIGSLCIYCMLSAILTALLFALVNLAR